MVKIAFQEKCPLCGAIEALQIQTFPSSFWIYFYFKIQILVRTLQWFDFIFVNYELYKNIGLTSDCNLNYIGEN